MKKENIYKFLYAISALLILGFVIRFGADIFKYDSYNDSAPLYAYAIIRVVEFIVPSVVVFIVGMIIKSKTKND